MVYEVFGCINNEGDDIFVNKFECISSLYMKYILNLVKKMLY